jgi:DnaJ-class molecular chaperone
MNEPVVCTLCDGSGQIPMAICPRCSGSGKMIATRPKRVLSSEPRRFFRGALITTARKGTKR